MATTSPDPSTSRKPSRNVCSFTRCGRSKARYPNLHFYKFPVCRPAICEAWVQNCANEALDYVTKDALSRRVVCEKHFEENCFKNASKTRLDMFATPTILSLSDIEDVAPATHMTENVKEAPEPHRTTHTPSQETVKEASEPHRTTYTPSEETVKEASEPHRTTHTPSQETAQSPDITFSPTGCELKNKPPVEVSNFVCKQLTHADKKKVQWSEEEKLQALSFRCKGKMTEVTVKDEPVDCESMEPREDNECISSPCERRKNFTVLPQTYGRRRQNEPSFEQIFIKEEPIVDTDEPFENAVSALHSDIQCHHDNVKTSESNNLEVYNKAEEFEITIEDVKMEDDDCTDEEKASILSVPPVSYKRSHICCAFTGCKRSKFRYPMLHFYTFPVCRPEICEAWIKNCANEALDTEKEKALNRKVVCEMHFEASCFKNATKSRLTKFAVPTIPSVPEEDVAETPVVVQGTHPIQETMVYTEVPVGKAKLTSHTDIQCHHENVKTSESNDLEIFNTQEGAEITTEVFIVEADDSTDDEMATISFIQPVSRKTSRHLCSFAGCRRSQARYPTLPFFAFPVCRPEICEAWIKNCANDTLATLNKKTLKGRLVCGLHFEESCFTSTLKKRIHMCAIPTIPSVPDNDEDVDEFLTQVQQTQSIQANEVSIASKFNSTICSGGKLVKHEVDECGGVQIKFPSSDSRSDKSDRNENPEESIETEPSTQGLLFYDDLNSSYLFEHNPICDTTQTSCKEETTTCFSQKQQKNTETEEKTCNTSALKVTTPVKTYKRSAPRAQSPDGQAVTENIGRNSKKKVKTNICEVPPSEKMPYSLVYFNDRRNLSAKHPTTDIQRSSPQGERIEHFASLPHNYKYIVIKEVHMCYYCSRPICTMKDHLLQEHYNEEEVKVANSFEGDTGEKQLTLLTRLGDFKHNVQVLDGGEGEMISLDGKCTKLSYLDKDSLLPCPDCAGFVHTQSFDNHHNSCIFKNKSTPQVNRDVLLQSKAMLVCSKKQMGLSNYWLNVVTRSLTKFEELIKLLALFVITISNYKYKDVSSVLELIQRMRHVLLLCCKLTDKSFQFEDILRPESLHFLFTALKTCLLEKSVENERVEVFNSLYSHISLITFIWRGKCIMDGNLKFAAEALQFFHCFIDMYKKEIISDGLICKKFMDSDHLDSTLISPADIVSLKKSLNERIVQLTNELSDAKVAKESTNSAWLNLAETTMCYLSLTNPIDFSIIENLKLAEYAVRPDSHTDDLTRYIRMSPFFCRFSKKHLFVCTEFHNNEIVILLSPTVKKAIDTLIKRRKEAGIPLTHRNIFSKSNGSTLSALSSFCNICIKEKWFFQTEVLTDLKERQYISHIVHISDMSQSEIETVKDYLNSSCESESYMSDQEDDGLKMEFKEALHSYEVSKDSVHCSCCYCEKRLTPNNDNI